MEDQISGCGRPLQSWFQKLQTGQKPDGLVREQGLLNSPSTRLKPVTMLTRVLKCFQMQRRRCWFSKNNFSSNVPGINRMTSFTGSFLFLSFTFSFFGLVDPTALKVRITNHALNMCTVPVDLELEHGNGAIISGCWVPVMSWSRLYFHSERRSYCHVSGASGRKSVWRFPDFEL